MSRLGSRSRAACVAAAVAVGTFLAGALALAVIASPANAATHTVTLTAKSFGTVDVDYGDTVTFTAGADGTVIGKNYQYIALSNAFGTIDIAQGTSSPPVTMTAPGSYAYSWKFVYKVLGIPATDNGSNGTITVASPPPPPSSSSVPPVDGSSTAPGTTAPSTGTSTPGSTAPASKTSTGASTPAGGITIGPGGVITSAAIPLGFGGPPPDPNQPTPSIPNPIGTGVGVVPTSGPASALQPTSSAASTQTLVEVASAMPTAKDRPTSLAIVAIAALAIVSSLYAYRRLGEQAQQSGH